MLGPVGVCLHRWMGGKGSTAGLGGRAVPEWEHWCDCQYLILIFISLLCALEAPDCLSDAGWPWGPWGRGR